MDRDGSGTLSLTELEVFYTERDKGNFWKIPARRGGGQPRAMSGVEPGKPAPDFTLKGPEGQRAATLSSFKGEKPVALIFGSYT